MASKGFVVSQYDDDLSAGDSKITFADKAKFKDNYCDVRDSRLFDRAVRVHFLVERTICSLCCRGGCAGGCRHK